jgi:trehalose 6-phosphate synthase
MLGEVSLIQIVIPSRPQIPDYHNLKTLIDSHAGRINARFARHGWVPIHYQFRTLDRTQLLAHYRACEIALITPLRDGMNLVAKEYCASSIDGNGVLILSAFAGAADQLNRGSIIVNPYDCEKTADAIYEAFSMEGDERARRMKALRAHVKRNDVHRWLSWIRAFSSSPEEVNLPLNTDARPADEPAEKHQPTP